MSTTATKERPILFSGAMVRAILDGTKTQTRRVCKPAFDGDEWAASVHPDGTGEGWIAWWPNAVSAKETKRLYPDGGFACPYGSRADRLWVKETWAEQSWTTIYGEQPGRQRIEIVYRAGPHPFDKDHPHGWVEGRDKWKSGRFMPRRASRATLEVTAVRVERLQSISEEDAIAEGIEHTGDRIQDGKRCCGAVSVQGEFARTWDAINGKRPGCDWASDPWVWVIEFERVKDSSLIEGETGE